jgi:hypothetical protein
MMDTAKYTMAISKGAGLIDQTRQLVRFWKIGESPDDFARRAIYECALGNDTAYRVRDILHRVFIPRFMRPNDMPARILKAVAESPTPSATFNELLFLFACRNDPLVYDYTVKEFWPAVRRGRTSLAADEVLSFISGALVDGVIERAWSEKTAIKIARGVLGILRDVGFLREDKRHSKEIVKYRITELGLAIIARMMHDEGISDSSIGSHRDWSLFGLSGAEVLDRLDELGEARGILVQRAGAVVHITWSPRTIEELIHVFTR